MSCVGSCRSPPKQPNGNRPPTDNRRRFSSWAEGVSSRVEMTFSEPDIGNTVVNLLQTGIPEEDKFHNHDVKIQVGGGGEGGLAGVCM
jgi:hypothetical protein